MKTELIFKSKYNYGPPEEVKVKQNCLKSFINSLFIRIFKFIIFPGAVKNNKIIDPRRVEEAEKQLISIGGVPVRMMTPDGDEIRGMHLDANNFKAHLNQYCELIEVENEDATISLIYTLKTEFCDMDIYDQDGKKYTQNIPKPEIEHFLENLKKLGISMIPRGDIPGKTAVKGYVINLGKIPKETQKLTISDSETSQPTVIIAPGGALPFTSYKSLAVAYLSRGISVMMVDYRGFGKSQGSPTDTRTELDVETAYQYLKEEHHVKNEDLLVHGYCLGGGPATDLAARRKGVNLLLDRTFSEFRDAVKEKKSTIGKLLYRIMPHLVDYNNAKKINQVTGNIAIIQATDDEEISNLQIVKLLDNLPLNEKTTHKLLYTTVGHTGLWTEEKEILPGFNQFLQQAGLTRKLT